MHSLPPTLPAAQLAAALEHIEALAQPRAESDATARKIWNACRRLRVEAEAQERVECATMRVAS